MKRAIVVGSGLAGIISARILVNNGYKVTIIENSKFIGGLISSMKIKNNFFDHGAHMLQETNDKKINKYLFKDLEKNCFKYKYLPQEHFFNKKWYLKSAFINLMHLDKKEYSQIFKQIILQNKLNDQGLFKNEEQRCFKLYGKKLTSKIIAPLLKKYTNKKLSQLPVFTKERFNLSRFIIANKKETDRLKKNLFLDKILAYNSYKQGITGKRNFYPKKQGINYLVNLFLDKKCLKKIDILTNQNIKSIKVQNSKFFDITTNKKKIIGDYLIWTGNIDPLENLINSKELKPNNKKKIYWSFYHFISKKRLRKKVFYSYFYDEKIPIHRITHYDNFQIKNKSNHSYRFTVENISGLENNYSIEEKIKESLIDLKIIKNMNDIKLLKRYTMPIPLKKTKYKISKNIKLIKNLILLGQGADKFTKSEIIEDTYNKLFFNK